MSTSSDVILNISKQSKFVTDAISLLSDYGQIYFTIYDIDSCIFEVLVLQLWQYGLWSFQTGGTKLERFLPKNQHTQRKFMNFENWTKGELQ